MRLELCDGERNPLRARSDRHPINRFFQEGEVVVTAEHCRLRGYIYERKSASVTILVAVTDPKSGRLVWRRVWMSRRCFEWVGQPNGALVYARRLANRLGLEYYPELYAHTYVYTEEDFVLENLATLQKGPCSND